MDPEKASGRIYSGSHSDEVQVSCPSPETARLLSVEVYPMRSGTAIVLATIVR
jgi:hypothetical protein